MLRPPTKLTDMKTTPVGQARRRISGLAVPGTLTVVLAASLLIAGCDRPQTLPGEGTSTAAVPTASAPTTPLPTRIPPTPQEQLELNNQLGVAAIGNDSAAVRRLLSAGAELESVGAHGRTPLVAATKANAVDAAKALIEAGANVNAQDDLQDSAFLYAGAEGLDEILVLAIAHGADVRSTNRYGGTALIPACEHGHVSTLRILLNAGVPVDHVNNLGWTGLLEAVILGSGGTDHQEVVRLLIAAGANVNLADFNGATPLAHAQANGQGAVVQLLKAAGAR